MAYQPTEKQGQAWVLAREGPKHVLLVGGSRSGKTTVFIEEILSRASMFPKSRHLIARLRFAHAKASIWMDTLPKVLEMEGRSMETMDGSETDHYIRLPNGSEIWVDGLDDKARVDKILGREYASIYFNECHEIPYDSVSTVLTRLAQKVAGCPNKAYYDLNPVGKSHWAFKVFFQSVAPADVFGVEDKPLTTPDQYASMYLQPDDNREHLPDGYIEETLDNLPEHKRRRFRRGEWGEPEGAVFPRWAIKDVPEEVQRRAKRSHGLDFGFSVAAAALVDLYLYGDDLYIDELLYANGLTNTQLIKRIKAMGLTGVIYGDSAEPKSIKELSDGGVRIKGAAKGQDSIRQGIDWLLGKNIYVTRRSYNIQTELQNYVWETDRTGRLKTQPIDDYNDAIDATRYGAEAFMRGAEKFKQKRIRGLV